MNIQRLYATINNIIYKVTSRLGVTICTAVVFICCLLLTATAFLYIGYYGDGEEVMVYGTVITVAITIFSVYRKSRDKVIWNKGVLIPLIAFGIGMIIISYHHDIGEGYLNFALNIVLLFPLLYYVWAVRRDVFVLYNCISIACIAEGFIKFFYCMFTALGGTLGMSETRVMADTGNPNLLGQVGLLMMIAALYMLTREGKTLYVALNASAAAAGFSLIVESVTRTSIICAVGCIASFVFFMMKVSLSGERRVDFKKIVIAICVIAVTLVVGLSMDEMNTRAVESNRASEESIEEEGVTPEEIDQTDDSNIGKIRSRMSKDSDINSFSSGRVAIWKRYLRHLSWTGKPLDEIREKEFGKRPEIRAHNNFLDYFYRFGYIVGAFYLIFYINVGVAGLKLLFSRTNHKPEHFFLVEIIGCYSFYSLVEIAVLSYTRVIPWIFFLSLSPLVIKNQERQEGQAKAGIDR